jgi:cobalt-zinc-cadmium efflux system membrane fusion protein
MNKIFIPMIGGLCILLASCRSESVSNNESPVTFDGVTVTVSDRSPVRSKIKLQMVERKDFNMEFHTTGVVRPITGQIAEIAPLFDGRVTRSFVVLGQRVNAGMPLFELYSAEFSEAVKDYFQSLQTKKLAESNRHRQQDLVRHGVGATRELEEAEASYELALRDYENAETTLKILHIDPEKVHMGQALTIVSPIAGEVVQTHITIGQYVKSDADPLAIVADLSRVWVAAQVKEKQINVLRKEDQVEIRTDANPEQTVTGRILHIGELLDEETRSVQVLIECDNKDRRLKPGMFAGVRFLCAPGESIVIPSTALLQSEDGAFVFVQEGKDRYVRRPVKAVTANGQEVQITAGLKAGEAVVSQGAFYLTEN